MTTVEEKQRELDALQSAFDDYIASSRELEEELDAELSKCQNDLTKVESINAALSLQLANTQPQLNSLEVKVSTLTIQLSSESQRRVTAEMKCEEAENRLRESEGALAAVRSSEMRKLKEENEDLCERLAFVEGEADDYRNELNTERERHREEIEELRGDVNVLTTKLSQREEELELLKVDMSNVEEEKKGGEEGDDEAYAHIGDVAGEGDDEIFDSTPAPSLDERDEYIKTLEEELELVTEQLIEAETKLSRTQVELDDVLAEAELQAFKPSEDGPLEVAEANNQLLEKIHELEEKNIFLQGECKKLKEELELVLEELALSKEELQAHDEDRKERSDELVLERKQYAKEVNVLQCQIEKQSSELRSQEIQSKSMEEALLHSKEETRTVKEDVVRLESALLSSREDCEKLQSAFDEISHRERVDMSDQNQAHEQIMALKMKEIGDLNVQVCELKEELTKVKDNNILITKTLKDAEEKVLSLQTIIDEQRLDVLDASAVSSSQELADARDAIVSLENHLEAKRKEVDDQQMEMAAVRASLQEKLLNAHTELTIAQEEMTLTRTKLMALESARSSRLAEDQSRADNESTRDLDVQKQLMDANSGHKKVAEKDDKEPVTDLISMEDSSIDDILQSNDPEMIAKEVRALAKKMSAQKSFNAELLTRILKLQGNIQVCCRIRPMTANEKQQGLHEVVQPLSETEVGFFDESTKSWKSYAFDKVWGAESKQMDVFQDVEPLALSVIDGYNACIFAYGQTGSGKTFTMEGSKTNSQYGISQRTIHKIFSLVQDKARQHQQNVNSQDGESPQYIYKIEVGMLEIYNDEVYDLLESGFATPRKKATSDFGAGSPQKKSLDIRLSAENTVEVPNLIKESVTSVAEVLNVLDRGNANRATASTNLNEHSSRSHMILRVDVTSGFGQVMNTGVLYLVDLAGSERVRKSEVVGKELKEAQHINKSLSALGNVMEALDRKASHVPYRDSKLTYLLQNSLGGNSRTMMVVTVCPHNNSSDETSYALKFAIRVRRINVGSAQKNVKAKNLEETVKSLTSEMQMISKAKERSESQLLTLKREKERVEEKLTKTSQSRATSKEEMKSLAVLKQTNDDITARWQKEKGLREEKTTELTRVQEELHRAQIELRSLKRDQESLQRQNGQKDDDLVKMKKDLQSLKEQLNGEKIRLRRSLVMSSRIPAPTSSPYAASTSRKTLPSKFASGVKPLEANNFKDRSTLPLQKISGLKPPLPRITTDASATDQASQDVARIRFRVLKMLQEHDPTKVAKIDVVMAKFEGRETELLEKMIARYEGTGEGGTNESSSIASESNTTCSDGRPKSRQDASLEKHMARMKRIRVVTGKES